MALSKAALLGQQIKASAPGQYDDVDDEILGQKMQANPIAMVKFQEELKAREQKVQEEEASKGVLDSIPGGSAVNSALHVLGAAGRALNTGIGKLSTAAGSPMDAPFSEQFRAAMVPHGPQATTEDLRKYPSAGGVLNQLFDTLAVVPKAVTSVGEAAGPEAQRYAEAVAGPVAGTLSQMAVDPITYGGLGALQKVSPLLSAAAHRGFQAQMGASTIETGVKTALDASEQGLTPEVVEGAVETGITAKFLKDASRRKAENKPVATEGTPDTALTGMRRDTFGTPADLPKALRSGGTAASAQSSADLARQAAGQTAGGVLGHTVGIATHIPGMNFILRQVGSRLGSRVANEVAARNAGKRSEAGIDPFARNTPLHESEITNLLAALDEGAMASRQADMATRGVSQTTAKDPLANLQDYEIEEAVQRLTPEPPPAPPAPPVNPIEAAKQEHARVVLENKMRAERIRARELGLQEEAIAREDALRAEHPDLPDLVKGLIPPKGPLTYDKAIAQARKSLGIEAPQAAQPTLTPEQVASEVAARDPFQSAENLTLDQTRTALGEIPEPPTQPRREFPLNPEEQTQLLELLAPEVRGVQPGAPEQLAGEVAARDPFQTAENVPAADVTRTMAEAGVPAPEVSKGEQRAKDLGVTRQEQDFHPEYDRTVQEWEQGKLTTRKKNPETGRVEDVPIPVDEKGSKQMRAIARGRAVDAIVAEREAAKQREQAGQIAGAETVPTQAPQEVMDQIVESMNGNVGAIRARLVKMGIAPEVFNPLLTDALARRGKGKPQAPAPAPAPAKPKGPKPATEKKVVTVEEQFGETKAKEAGFDAMSIEQLGKLQDQLEAAQKRETDPVDAANLQNDIQQVAAALEKKGGVTPLGEVTRRVGKPVAKAKVEEAPQKAPEAAKAAPEAAPVAPAEARPVEKPKAPEAPRKAPEGTTVRALLEAGDREGAKALARSQAPDPEAKTTFGGKEYGIGDSLPDGRFVVEIEDGIPTTLRPKGRGQYSMGKDYRSKAERIRQAKAAQARMTESKKRMAETNRENRAAFEAKQQAAAPEEKYSLADDYKKVKAGVRPTPKGRDQETRAAGATIEMGRIQGKLREAEGKKFSAGENLPELPSGFKVSEKASGKAKLLGPDGEDVSVRLAGDTLEVWRFDKMGGENSRNLINAIREFAEANESKKILFASSNKPGVSVSSNTAHAIKMQDRIAARGEGRWLDNGQFELNLKESAISDLVEGKPPLVTAKQIRSQLPAEMAKNLSVDGEDGSFVIQTPRGTIRIKPSEGIELDYAVLGETYGSAAVEAAKAGKLKAEGRKSVVSGEALLDIVRKGALPHELGHVFLDHFATAKERAVLEKKFDALAKEGGKSVDELISDGYRDYFNQKQANPGWVPTSTVGKYFKKVYDFIHGAFRAVNPNAESIFEEMRTGKAFERKGEAISGGEGYSAGPRGAGSALGRQLKEAQGLRQPRGRIVGVMERGADLTPRLAPKANPLAGAETSKAKVENATTVATPGAVAPKSYSIETVEGTMADVRKYNAKNKVFTDEQVKKYEKDLKSVTAIVHMNLGELGYEAIKGMSALKGNSDKRYGKSLDFTTLCRRRYILSDTVDAIQRATKNSTGENKILDAEDIIKVRSALEKQGHEVNCGPCYVESRRINISTAVNKAKEGFVDNNKKSKTYGKTLRIDPKYHELLLDQAGRDRLFAEHPEQYKILGRAFAGTQIKIPVGRAAYAGEILKLKQDQVDKFNKYSGLRSQSWSDFEVPHLLDKMQAVYDMAARKLKGHSYTKEINYVETMKDTGEAINMSLIPEGTGFGENGRLQFNKNESIRDMDRAKALRDKHDNVGFEAIGISDKHIEALLANKNIDYVIPYHSSGLSLEYQHVGKMKNWTDYTDSAHWRDAKTGEAVGVEREIFVDEWKGDLKKLDKLAKERGVVPPFQQFRNAKGYEKLLVDRRIWDKNGKFIEQKPVEFKFDMNKVHKMLGEYKGEHNKRTAVQSVVDEFTPKGKKYSAGETKKYKAGDIASEEAFDAEMQKIRDEGPPGLQLEAFVASGGDLYVDTIRIPKEQQGKGAGTATMRKLIKIADENGMAMSLDPQADTGKRTALEKFYRSLGFGPKSSSRFYDPTAKGLWVRPAKKKAYSADDTKKYKPRDLTETAGNTAIPRKEASTAARAWTGQLKDKAGNVIPGQTDRLAGHTVFEWGAGQGADVRYYQSRGLETKGYDPNWKDFSEKPEGMADVVTSTYVGNVLPPNQRNSHWIEAFGRARKSLLVTVRNEVPKGIRKEHDGVIVKLKGEENFQRAFTQDELLDQLKKLFPGATVEAGPKVGSGVTAVVTRKSGLKPLRPRGPLDIGSGYGHGKLRYGR